ncbi:hypothetical protein STEG23_013470, partial [Scotinomys teguina]
MLFRKSASLDFYMCKWAHTPSGVTRDTSLIDRIETTNIETSSKHILRCMNVYTTTTKKVVNGDFFKCDNGKHQ